MANLGDKELEKLRYEYERVCSYMIDPPSFEVWLKSKAQG